MHNLAHSQLQQPGFFDFRQPLRYGIFATSLFSTAFYLPISLSSLFLLLLGALFVVDFALCLVGFKHQATFISLLAASTLIALSLGMIEPRSVAFLLLIFRNLGLAYLRLMEDHIIFVDVVGALLCLTTMVSSLRMLHDSVVIVGAAIHILSFLFIIFTFRSIRTFWQVHTRLRSVLLDLEQENKRLIKDQLRFQRDQRRLEELGIMKERIRLSRELHDTVVHAQSAIVIQLEAALRLIKQRASDAESFIQQARNIARSSMEDIRRSLRAMRPSKIERNGLEGLAAIARDFSERTGITTQVDFSGFQRFEKLVHSAKTLPADKVYRLNRLREETLYSTLQEALSNAQRHAPHCTLIEVRLSCDSHGVLLEVENDGLSGPLQPPLKKGIGLKGMQERAKECHGNIQWHPSKKYEYGFLLQLTLPWPKSDEREGVAL